VNSFVCYTGELGSGTSPPPNEEKVFVVVVVFFLRLTIRFTMYKVENTEVYK
jgi:hypothetical protein